MFGHTLELPAIIIIIKGVFVPNSFSENQLENCIRYDYFVYHYCISVCHRLKSYRSREIGNDLGSSQEIRKVLEKECAR